MIGWLLDTNVIAEIIAQSGAARVKAWAAGQDEATLFLSILTIGEYEKGIANLPDDDRRRPGVMNLRDGLVERFGERLLPVSDAIVRRWGVVSGHVRRQTGHPIPRHRHASGRYRDRARSLPRHPQHPRRAALRSGLVQPLG